MVLELAVLTQLAAYYSHCTAVALTRNDSAVDSNYLDGVEASVQADCPRYSQLTHGLRLLIFRKRGSGCVIVTLGWQDINMSLIYEW